MRMRVKMKSQLNFELFSPTHLAAQWHWCQDESRSSPCDYCDTRKWKVDSRCYLKFYMSIEASIQASSIVPVVHQFWLSTQSHAIAQTVRCWDARKRHIRTNRRLEAERIGSEAASSTERKRKEETWDGWTKWNKKAKRNSFPRRHTRCHLAQKGSSSPFLPIFERYVIKKS